MPALNIDFTEDEMTLVRARAAEQGVSLRKHVHDTALETSRRDSENNRIMEAVARLKVLYAGALEELADK